MTLPPLDPTRSNSGTRILGIVLLGFSIGTVAVMGLIQAIASLFR